MTPLLVLFCYLLPLFVLSHLEVTFFLTRQHSYFGVMHCENSEFQIVFFWKLIMLGLETCTKIYFLFIFYFDFII